MTAKIAVILMVVLLALAPVGGAAAMDTPTGESEAFSVSTASADDVRETPEENISVWERSALPFRADLDAASTVVENQVTFINAPDGEEVEANREEVGVFDTGDIPLTYEGVSGATTSDFSGSDVTVIAGQLEPNVSTSDIPPLSFLSADNLSDEATLENLNDNVSFEAVDETEITAAGEFADEIEYEATESGQYISMVATIDDEPGLEVDNGDLDPQGNSTIIGVDAMTVQDGPSSVDHDSSAEPGDTVSFDIDTDLSEGNTSHAVVLYDEETFINERLTIDILEDPSMDSSIDDVEFRHTIKTINGISSLEDDVSLFGMTVGAQNSSGMTDVSEIVSFIADETDDDVNDVNLTAIDDTILNASATAVADRNASGVTVDVETLDDWDEGDYRWIHVAGNDSTQELATSDGTVEIAEEDDDTGAPGGGGIGGPGPAPPDDPPETQAIEAAIDIQPNPAETGEQVTFDGTDSVASTDATITDYEWEIDGDSYDGESVTETFDTAGDVDVSLTVTDDAGETDTATKTLTVDEDAPPTPNAVIQIDPDPAETGEEVSFDASGSTVSDGSIDSYEWEIDGDSYDGQSVTETFDDSGTVDVELTVTTDQGETDTTTAELEVESSSTLPVPGFGPVVTLIALLALGAFATRRQP